MFLVILLTRSLILTVGVNRNFGYKIGSCIMRSKEPYCKIRFPNTSTIWNRKNLLLHIYVLVPEISRGEFFTSCLQRIRVLNKTMRE